jgi:hypothetical protein
MVAASHGGSLPDSGYLRDMAPRRVLALLLVAATPLLGACGGDDKSKAANNGPTRPQYIAEVNALCSKVTRDSRPTIRKIQALIEGSGSYSSRLRKGAPLLRDTYDAQAAKLADFKKIAPPKKDVVQIRQLTVAAEGALGDLRDALPAADKGDLPPIIDLATDASGNRAKVERLGVTYGFQEDCFGLPVKLQ